MEYKKKCNVCGKVFCYTDEDLKNNASNAGLGALSALGGLASALGGGTIFHTHHLQGQADRYTDKIVDYNQCPYCHSRSLSVFTGDVEEHTKVVKTVNINASASTESLLKRVFIFLEDGEWETANAYCEACLDKDPESAKAYLGKLMAELRVKVQGELQNQLEPFDRNSNYQKVIRYADDELRDTLISYIKYINNRNEDTRKDKVLCDAKAKMTGNVIADYEEALSLLASIPGWGDADERKSICQSKIVELKTKEEADRLERERLAEIEREKAEQKIKAKKKMAMIVTPIIVVLIIAAVVINGIVRQKQEEAAKLDAYNAAVALLENGEYSKAISALSALGDYKDCEELVAAAKLEESYYSAMAYIEDGKYSEAAAIFEQLGDYKDCKEQLAATEIPLLKENIARINVGGTLTFGTYEQDNNTANGAEPIEWIVLQSDEPDFPYVMAISKYVLDAQPFHSEKGLITWENCSLRTWLNNDFLTSAFTDEEIALLSPIYLPTPDNPTNGTDCGNDTLDTVFLLCAQEASYWADIVGDETPTTAYAQSKGLREKASWMFRTVYEGNNTNSVCVAYWSPEFGSTRSSIDQPNGLRPCIVFIVGNQ